MCEALRDLMKDEIQKEIQEAVQDAVQATQQAATDAANIAAIRNLKAKQNLNNAQAMDTLGISPADQIRYAPML